MIAQEIKDEVASYFARKGNCVHFEVGLVPWGKLRADVVAMTMKGQVTIVEVKSSYADYVTDHKWRGYTKFAHKFYFAMTEDVYEEVCHLVPADVGVLAVCSRTLPSGRVRKKVAVVQRTGRNEVPSDSVFNLAIRLAFKTSDRSRYKRR